MIDLTSGTLDNTSPNALTIELSSTLPIVNTGVFVQQRWQSTAHQGALSHLAWAGENLEQRVILASRSLLVTQYKRVVFTSSKPVLNQTQLAFKASILEKNIKVITWQHSAIKARNVVMVFSHNALLNTLLATAWLDQRQPKVVFSTVTWSEGYHANKHNPLTWQTRKEVTPSNLVVQYGVAPLSLICHVKNHPQHGLVILSFDTAVVDSNAPITMTLEPKKKICVQGNAGGLLRANDDLPVIDFKIPIKPQLRSSYIMKPTITCERLSDNLHILITSFSYQNSRAQFAATCSLKFCSRLDYERAQSQLLKITVNGYDFFTYVEKRSKTESFNSKSFTATGRSRFAELTEPYTRATSYTNEAPKTFLGLMTDIIKNTPWTINSDIIDYPVPALSFSYKDKTPAQALALCANAIGAMLKIDDSQQQITVLPMWPVMPWLTDSATCDVVINDSVIISHTTTDIIQSESNVVMVRGEQQGVSTKIKRASTAADLYASDVVDKLITDNQAARQRGSYELANTGNKEQSTIRTKLLNGLPPILPGMLVGIQYSASLYKATCDNSNITATVSNEGKITVNQTITLLKKAAS